MSREGDMLTSEWQFMPNLKQDEIECRLNGKEELSAKRQITLELPEITTTMTSDQEIKESLEEKSAVFWIPHNKYTINEDMNEIEENEEIMEEGIEESLSVVEEEFRRAENVPAMSAHKMKKSDLSFRVEEVSASSLSSSASSFLLSS